MWSRCNPTEAVDTHRHSGNSHTFLFQNGTHTGVGRTGYEPSVTERPKTGGSSVRPLWKQSAPQCGNQTTSTGQTLAAKVTPSPSPSKSAGLPEAKTTSGART